MRRRLLILAGILVVLVITIATLISVIVGGGEGDPDLDGFSSPRTLHLAPDGRLLVTDAGSGTDDGRIVAIDLDTGERQVLMSGLPSARVEGPEGGVHGASGAAMAPNGTVCAVIGQGPPGKTGFAAMRCTSGLTLDLAAHSLQLDDRGPRSDPFDIVWRSPGVWYVSDAGADTISRVDASGTIRLITTFGFPHNIPMGLSVDSEDTLLIAVNGGAIMHGGRALDAKVSFPIAVVRNGTDIVVLSQADVEGRPGTGTITVGGRVVVSGLDRPTGMVRLRDGRYIVAEQARGLVRIVAPQ